MHDGRLLTLEDTVEFFNLILSTKLDDAGKTRSGGVHAHPLAGRTTRSSCFDALSMNGDLSTVPTNSRSP